MVPATTDKRGAADAPPLPSLDELQREATARAGMAIGDWLTGINMNRPIHRLTRDELTNMAAVAISAWVLARAGQATILGTTVHDEALFSLQGG